MLTLRQPVYGPTPWELELMERLVQAALDTGREALKARARARPRAPRRNLTLRPGAETPLWNELVRQVRPHLRRYGAKAQLARLLGVPRQRLQDCLRAKSACLDAERTLLLLGWLGFFQRGGEIIPVVRPGRRPQGGLPGNV